MKLFNTDKGGIVVGVFFTLLALTCITLGVLDTINRTYVYQGETQIITQDAVKLTIPWKIEYTWYYFVPKDYKSIAEKELDDYCDYMLKEKYQTKYPLVDFINGSGDINELPQRTKSILQPMLKIDTLYRNGLIEINEKDNKHIQGYINEYIDEKLGVLEADDNLRMIQQIKADNIREQIRLQLEHKFLNQLENGTYN